MNTVEVALAAILWQVFHLRRNIVSMLPALWRMTGKPGRERQAIVLILLGAQETLCL